MKTKRNTPSKVPDILVVLICLSGIVVSLWMFWTDLNATLTKQSETPIAEIEFKRKYAQRKFSDRVVWDRLQQRSPIYNGDTIRTAALSEAIITFEGKDDRIQLSENSIVQILIDEDGGARIDLSGGNINIDKQDSTGSFTLVSGGNEISVEAGSRINIQSNTERDDLSLTVMTGSVSLSGAQGTVTMDAGSALKVSSDGTAESFVTIVDISAYPDSYAEEVSPTNIPVQFVWNTVDFAENKFVRLEIARDRNFSHIRQSVNIADRNDTILTMDSAGSYYWRIYPAGSENDSPAMENASTGKFDLAYSEAPKLISPMSDYTYRYRTKKPAIRMYWTGENQDAWYQVEIADNPAMNNPETMLVQEASMTNSSLDAGDWYWRITPIYPNGFLVNTTPSEIGHFTIEQGRDLQAPELLSPVPEAALDMAEERSSAHFSWKYDPEAVSYTIQISASANLDNPVISNTITGNFYSYAANQNILQTGQYYWAVYKTDSEGNISPMSESRPFFAAEEKIEYATLFPPENYIAADNHLKDLIFSWESNLSVSNRFQIAENIDFSNPIIDETTNDLQYQVSALPAGDYYWRIVTEAGAPALSSAPKSLKIVPQLDEPLLINPAPESSLIMSPGTNIDFTWEPVEEADYYQFKLYRGAEQIFENLSLETVSQSYAMDELQQGEYQWTVQAFIAENENASQRDSLIASSSLSMRNLQSVSLDYPVRDRIYEGLAALNNPDSVRWSSVETVTGSRFILSTHPNPLANPSSIIVETRNPGNNIRLPSLRTGTYYWTIIASDINGNDISAVRPSSFRVLPIPPLPASVAVLPQNDYVIDIEELAAVRGVNFEWQPVEGANQYIFSLYIQNDSGSLTPIVENQSIRGTSYAFDDMSVLDTGNFIWRIEAQTRRIDGTVDRRGNVGEFNFMIDLPEVGVIKTNDPGILYGN
jgi:hypothetical protein